jgi:hypothetical protein
MNRPALTATSASPSVRAMRHSAARVVSTTSAPTPNLSPSELLTIAALLIRFPWFRKGFWAKMRCRGEGPAFLRIGGTVLYRECDVLAWLESRRATSTSDRKRTNIP